MKPVPTTAAAPTVTAVVLAFGAEPTLPECVTSVLASDAVSADVVVVDNGCTSDAVDRVCRLPGVRVVRPARNLGFAGGVGLGAAQASGEFLALVNSDAAVEPRALAELCAVAAEPGVGVASASIRLADRPDIINSAGNPVHFLGLSWAGGHGEPAAWHRDRRPVASASGAGLVLRRALWQALGGFAAEYFAYLEDAELSLRCWQRGLRVEYVPDAVVRHHYEFSRNPRKQYLLERNRLLLVLTLYERRTLLLLAPALVAFDAALLVVAARQGWAREKVEGWGWLLRHRSWVRRRRAQLQGERSCGDRELAALLTTRINPANVPLPPGIAVLNGALAGYWRVVRAMLGASAYQRTQPR